MRILISIVALLIAFPIFGQEVKEKKDKKPSINPILR